MRKVWQNRVPLSALTVAVAILCVLAAACSGSNASNPDVTAKVGESAKTGNFEATITSVYSIGAFGSSFSTQRPADGATFVVVRSTLKNISGKPQSLMLASIKLADAQGTVYEQAITPTMSYKIEQGIDTKSISELNPGLAEKDATLFEVSKELWSKPGWKVIVDADKMIAFTIK